MKKIAIRIPGTGMRTIKTAVAVVLCLVIFELIRLGGIDSFFTHEESAQPPTAFYACTAAIICMQDTVERSIKKGAHRLVGTAVGGAVGLLILLFDDAVPFMPLTILAAGVGIVMCISLCNILKFPDASAICCVVLVAILMNHNAADRYLYAVYRMLETVVGIMVAVLVNKFLGLPKRRTGRQPEGAPPE